MTNELKKRAKKMTDQQLQFAINDTQAVLELWKKDGATASSLARWSVQLDAFVAEKQRRAG